MGRSYTFTPIGVVRSDHHVPRETPIQPPFARGCRGRAELLPEYEPGLQDIEGFSHVILLYCFHQAAPGPLAVQPFLVDDCHGVFATRHPCRPNPIGLSVVRLVRREGATLLLDDVDILDGSPLLDLKPFIAGFDVPENPTAGWTERISPAVRRDRGRRGYRGPAKTGEASQ